MERLVHIIDDDSLWRAVVVGMLDGLGGYDAVEWHSGSAFDAASDKRSGIALIDVKMPGLSGTQVLQRLDQQRFLPIMMAGNADIALAVAAVKQGAFDFLEKPCSPEKLAEALSAGFEVFEVRYREGLAREEMRRKFEALSDREREIVREIAADNSNRDVSEKFGISIRTVEAHRARVMLKLGSSSFADVVRLAQDCGFAGKGNAASTS